MWKFPAVFAALFALDFVWARYTAAMTEKHAHAAAHYAAGIILLSGFGVVQYANDPWLLIPAACGAWAGTFVAVNFQMESIMKHAKGWTVYRIRNPHARRAVITLGVLLFAVVFLVCLVIAFAWNIGRASCAAVMATVDEVRDGLKGCGTATAKAWLDFD